MSLDPVAFVHDCLSWRSGEGPTFYQEDALASLPLYKRVCMRGPHGLGKTTLNAWTVLWFSLTRDGVDSAVDGDWKCLQTASVWRQLERYLWPEIRKWRSRLRWDVIGRDPFDPKAEAFLMSMRLKTGEAFPVASDNYDFIEGAHADRILYIFDESKAIPGATFDAAEGAFSGAGDDTGREAFGLACSTPGRPQGRFYEIQSRKAGYEDWHVIRVTKDDAIKAGRISAQWAEQRAKQWGVGTALYQNRVEGEFASSAEDSVIPLAWIEAAVDRWHVWSDAGMPGELTSLGVDVGRGGDKSVLAPVYDKFIVGELEKVSNQETMQIVGWIGMRRPVREKNVPVIIDVVGVGAGVVDRGRELGYRIVAFSAGRKTKATDRSGELLFMDLRSAAWWWTRELLDPENGFEVALPDDEELIGELSAPTWWPTSGGKIQVEPKISKTEEGEAKGVLRQAQGVRKKIGRSTDSADAVIQGLVGQALVAFDEDDEPEVSVGGY